MVVLVERLFFRHSLFKLFPTNTKLDNNNNHPHGLLSPDPLRAFQSHVSDCLNQLSLNSNSDEVLISSSLSLPWILRCLELLSAVNKAFAKVVTDIHYPINRWEAALVDDHLAFTLTLLDYLNSMASSLSHLSHARLAMSHALGLVESSPALAIDRLRGAIQFFNINNPRKDHHLKKLEIETSTTEERHFCSGGEERAVREALTAVKSIGYWVSAAVLAALSGDPKTYLDMKNLIAAASTSRGLFPCSLLTALDSSSLAAVINGKRVAVREVETVNEAAACLVTALEAGEGAAATTATAAEELRRDLEEIQKLLDAIGKEADAIFSEIWAHRNGLLDGLRKQQKQS